MHVKKECVLIILLLTVGVGANMHAVQPIMVLRLRVWVIIQTMVVIAQHVPVGLGLHMRLMVVLLMGGRQHLVGI